MIKKKIQSLLDEVFNQMIEIRRHIHMFPELSKQEKKTADYISAILQKWNIPHEKNIGGYGIVAIIEGQNPNAICAALRADMDALPINEENDVPYKSQNQGIMHACGHDAHVAALLGTAFILNNIKDEFVGRVKLVFQPSEERFPGGAKKMIEAGVLENPKVDFMLGQHVLPTLETGKIGVKPGMYMASTDEIFLIIKGKGGHAATPELNIDSVLVAAEILTSLQQIVSRKNTPSTPSVLSFGRFIADGQTNIIPDIVTVDGTFRTFDEEWRKKAHEQIVKIASGVAESMGASCEVKIVKGYPYLVNDHDLTMQFSKIARNLLGDDFIDLPLRMTAEDFAYYSQKVASVFYRFGVANESKNINSNLHTATFDIDEEALKTATLMMSNACVSLMEFYLKKKKN